MGLFKRKSDPFVARERALANEIDTLEQRIQKYESQLSSIKESGGTRRQQSGEGARGGDLEPTFESVDQRRLTAIPDKQEDSGHYNEFGARKYDVGASVKRVADYFRPPTTSNPRLVSYLAAGGIQGLQPLRREKRIARNRFLALVGLFLLILIGILTVFMRQR